MVECPCCGYPTLNKRLDNEICYLCQWEDDLLPSGPNFDYSINEAQDNFKKYLIMYRSSDYKFTKFRNTKIDEIKTDIISIYNSKLISTDEKTIEIKELKSRFEEELKIQLEKYYQHKHERK